MGAGMKKAAMKKAMKKKSVSKIARGRLSKVMVLRGSKAETVGGLKASDLTKNKHGRVVSKKRSAKGKKSGWIAAVGQARKALKLKGFCASAGSPRRARPSSRRPGLSTRSEWLGQRPAPSAVWGPPHAGGGAHMGTCTV